MKFTSFKCSLAEIVSKNLRFNIPIYQRLYVWDHNVVQVFLTDLKNAFFNTNQQDYFIGSIVFIKNAQGSYDLIDGQQRNTTLWLISNVLGHSLNNFSFVDENTSRLNFSIRDNVTAYFHYLRHNRGSEIGARFEGEEDLKNISRAYIQIKGFIENEENELHNRKEEFANYIYRNVKLICTEVPAETDRTKLFEVINARGVQLRQDEILKAQLLAVVNKNEQLKLLNGRLSKIWEACADMEGHVAYNLKAQLSDQVTWRELLSVVSNDEEGNDNSLEITEAGLGNGFIDSFLRDPKYTSIQGNIAYNLTDLLSENIEIGQPPVEVSIEESRDISSIVSFPMLLLHTLRIFLRERGLGDIPFFSEKKLLEIFRKGLLENVELKGTSQDDFSLIVVDFFKCLWKTRVIFDNNVVKWISSDSEKELRFVKIYFTKKDDTTLPKLESIEYNSYTALQSMLYHSQEMITQFWLTPFLFSLYKNGNTTSNEAFEYLRKLDNKLLSSIYVNESMKTRTWELMRDFNLPQGKVFNKDRFEIVDKNEVGVKFPHYWFYKLEYVLFYQFSKKPTFLRDLKINNPEFSDYQTIEHPDLWEAYKITAKNSVEHISPQHPGRAIDELCEEMLNHFGNLALVTRSINSSYSNFAFNVKQAKFFDNLKNSHIDALKLYLIYSNWDEETWNDETAEKHQKDMNVVLENYFYNNS